MSEIIKKEISELDVYKTLVKNNQELAGKVLTLASLAEEHLKDYVLLFPHYTDHSIKHAINVLNNMYALISNPDKLSATDLYLIICSALLHDAGMVLDSDSQSMLLKEKYVEGMEEYSIGSVGFDCEDEEEKKAIRIRALQDTIRKKHGERVKIFLEKLESDHGDLLKIGQQSIRYILAKICESHNWAMDKVVSKIEDNYMLNETSNPKYVALLLRLGDAIDLSPDRAGKITYENYNVENDENSVYHWAMNGGIKNTQKIINAEPDDCFEKLSKSYKCYKREKQIIFQPKSFNEYYSECSKMGKDMGSIEDEYMSIQSNVYQYIQSLEQEISDCVTEALTFKDPKYHLHIKSKIIYDLEPRYLPNYQIKMNYAVVVSNLLGTGLYGEPRVGLREIVQNSIDACKWRAAKNEYSFGQSPAIDIEINEQQGYVSINDNGVGMDLDVLKNCFLGIGNSIYSNSSYTLSDNQFSHIGKHGIGFFAAFMLSSDLVIRTYSKNSPYEIWASVNDKKENAYIRKITDNHMDQGTRIILKDIERFKSIFAPCSRENSVSYAVKHYIEDLFLNDDEVKINFTVSSISPTGKREVLYCDVLSLRDKMLGENINEKQIVCLTDHLAKEEIECYARFSQKEEKRRLFVYDYSSEDFVESEWTSVMAEYQSICTIFLPQHEPIVLYVPPIEHNGTVENDDPFGLVNSSQREKTYYGNSKIFNNAKMTIREFCEKHDIPIIKYPCIGYVEKVFVKKLYDTVLIFKKNSELEGFANNSNYIHSGKSYLDKIYARNVLIPNAHLILPYNLIAVNGRFYGNLLDLVININSSKIYPTLKRDNLDKNDIDRVSYAIGRALMLHSKNSENELVVNRIIEELFGKSNSFTN